MKLYFNYLSERMLSALRARGFDTAMNIATDPTELGPDDFALEVFEREMTDQQILASLNDVAISRKTAVLLLWNNASARKLAQKINDHHPNVTVLVGYDDLAVWVVDMQTRRQRPAEDMS